MTTEASSGAVDPAGAEPIRSSRIDHLENLKFSQSTSPNSSIYVPDHTATTFDSALRNALGSNPALPSLGASFTTPVAAPGWLSRFASEIQGSVQRTLADQVTPLRLAGHLSVLVIAAVVLILSQIRLPEWELSLQATPNPTAAVANTLNSTWQSAAALLDDTSLRRNLVLTLVDKKVVQEAPRLDTTYYRVKAGDTVLAIAAKFGLQPETIMWSNSNIEQNPDRLSIGDELRILPVDGVLHVVKPGETLSDLADQYKVKMDAIVSYAGNGLADASAPLPIGKEIVIPGGTKPFTAMEVNADSTVYAVERPADAPAGSGNFSWPTTGYISQGFWGGHRAEDIAGSIGTAVTAADGGYVILAGGGWSGGYGNHVIIDHGNGYTTLYAHLTSIFVTPGMTVSKGQQIGTMGSTGNSTGPHLHFEIRYKGVPYNPANYLK